MNIPSLIIALLLVTSLLAPLSFVTYLVFILPVFGSLALLPPELVGGSSLTPGSFAVLFFVIKALASRSVFQNAIRTATDFRQLGFLFLYLIIAVLGAFILPRLFEGTVHVYTMRTGQWGFVTLSTTNYTQAAYLTLSTLLAACIAVKVRSAAFIDFLLKAMLFGAYAVMTTGLLDIIASHIGLDSVLDSFRTASYVFMTNNVVAGARRVIGLMPEASAYGSMAASFCGLLLFLRPAFPPNLWRWKIPAAAWGCGLMALLSTSSTAYVMMAVILGLYTFYNTHRVTSDGSIVKKTLSKKILALIGGTIFILLILIFDQELATRFINLIDVLIFQKQQSTSYADRTGITLDALNSFLESDGMGVGIGSLSASNFFVSVLASTGVLGFGLFLMSLWVIFTRHAQNSETRAKAIIRAAKLSLIPIFAGATLSGTTPDFGPIVAVLFGIITGLSQRPETPKWASPHLLNRASNKNGRKTYL